MGEKHERSAVRFGCVFRLRIPSSTQQNCAKSASAHYRYMDKQDLKILDLLQKDGSIPAAQIAERVALSKVPCWRRIQRMQEDGVIRTNRRAARRQEPERRNDGIRDDADGEPLGGVVRAVSRRRCGTFRRSSRSTA